MSRGTRNIFPQESDPRKAIGLRLREFADKSGGPTALARSMGVTPQYLNVYLSGRSVPGTKLQARLREVGCDTTWLITGQSEGEIKRDFEMTVRRLMKEHNITKDEIEIISVLRSFGIRDTIDLWEYMDSKKLHKRLDSLVKDRIKAQSK